MERKNTRKVVAGVLLGSVLAGQVSLGASRAEALIPTADLVVMMSPRVENPIVTVAKVYWMVKNPVLRRVLWSGRSSTKSRPCPVPRISRSS